MLTSLLAITVKVLTVLGRGGGGGGGCYVTPDQCFMLEGTGEGRIQRYRRWAETKYAETRTQSWALADSVGTDYDIVNLLALRSPPETYVVGFRTITWRVLGVRTIKLLANVLAKSIGRLLLPV